MKLWLIAFVSVLVACGGGGSPSTGDSSSSSSTTPTNTSTTPNNDTSPNPNIDTSVAAPSLPGWILVWSDEFSGTGLPDAKKWTYDTHRNQAGWYNNEKQYYARARWDNSRIEGGRLIITARKERLSSAPDYGGQNYTSARLITQGLASWTYGFFEIRAKMPCGLGTWPAIWMLGTGGRWPDDGEIDIMEQRGTSAAEKQSIMGSVHTRAYNWSSSTIGVAKSSSTPLPKACTEFNNYQLTWDADQIQIGVNGVNYFWFLNPKNGDTREWPFHANQYLLLNLAMGGDLGGNIDDAQLPAQFEIDYVRVYQRP
jgi:beta-glucanase (GH16 family)